MPNDGIHTFAIGDVHGRADLLSILLDHIAASAARRGFRYRVIFLGDIIDKGLQSREAMDIVARTLAAVPGSRFILGNHDSMPVRIMAEQDRSKAALLLQHWLLNQGGFATIRSYGYDVDTISLDSFRHVFDPEHLALFEAAEHYVEDDNQIFVHAGIVPGVALADQTPYDLMWVRLPFLTYEGSFGKLVVHGHTPTASGKPELYANRLALDTKAFASGNLTAAHFAGGRLQEIFWTDGMPPEVKDIAAAAFA